MFSQPKRNTIIVALALGLSLGVIHGWNPFSKDDWEDVGKGIKGGFETVGGAFQSAFEKGVSFAGKVFHDAKSLADEVFQKIGSCVQVATLGAQWTAKKAAYETARATLQAADKLQVLDPRTLALRTSEETAKAALTVANGSLEAAKKSAEGLSKAMQALATAGKKGFNVKEVSFEAYMSKLLEAKAPKITLVAEIFGQSISVKDFEFDFSNGVEGAKKLIKLVIDKITG